MRNIVANNAADRKLSVFKTLIRRKEFVSSAANRLDHIEFKAMIDFGPQATDMAFDHAGLRIEMNAPHVFEEHPPREHPIRVAHEILEQAKFLRQQVDALARAQNAAL